MSEVNLKKKIDPFPYGSLDIGSHTEYNKESDQFIIEYKEVQVVKKTGDKETDFILDTRIVEDSRVPRQEYIDSFKNEVGIMNVLEKVRMTGDVTLLNQTKRTPVPGVKTGDGVLEDIVDVSNIPNSFIEADKKIAAGHEAFKKLPDELKGKLGFDDFVAQSDDRFNAYIEALKLARSEKVENKEDK